MKVPAPLFMMLCLFSSPSFSFGSKFLEIPRENCKRNILHSVPEKRKPKTPLKSLLKEELPSEWFWGNVSGVNYLTLVRNQHLPQYCGSCWALAATSSLSDRIKIMRNASFPEIDLAPQVLLSCDSSSTNLGCHGGDSIVAYEYIAENNITEESCSVYQSWGWEQGLPCSNELKCKNCIGDSCWWASNYSVYGIESYGYLSGEIEMMNEIYSNGPISCGIANPYHFQNFTGGYVYTGPDRKNIDHEVSVVGWGVQQNGTEFWIIRNSWGPQWAENGFFRLLKGQNLLQIESENACSFAIPRDSWTSPVLNNTDWGSQTTQEIRDGQGVAACYIRNNTEEIQDLVVDVLPQEHISGDSLPLNFSWGDYNGINFLSWMRNEHVPQYCASCWAMATTSAFADRINIFIREGEFPVASISPQVLLNCEPGGGSCNGGDPEAVHRFFHLKGISEDGCQNYEAKNPAQASCDDIHVCENCKSPIPPSTNSTSPGECWATQKILYYASQYGRVSGEANMKAEIYARGPIVCSLETTEKFSAFKGTGVFEEEVVFPIPNHLVSLLGWGVENGENYWLGRNSWGEYWGNKGFFKIKRGSGTLGIENDCFWAVPSTQKPQE